MHVKVLNTFVGKLDLEYTIENKSFIENLWTHLTKEQEPAKAVSPFIQKKVFQIKFDKYFTLKTQISNKNAQILIFLIAGNFQYKLIPKEKKEKGYRGHKIPMDISPYQTGPLLTVHTEKKKLR